MYYFYDKTSHTKHLINSFILIKNYSMLDLTTSILNFRRLHEKLLKKLNKNQTENYNIGGKSIMNVMSFTS